MKFALIAAVCLASAAAGATPPPVGSPDAEALGQYSPSEREWIAHQHDQMGRPCCESGEFSFINIREKDGNLQIQAKHPDKARGIPDGWHTVQDDRRVDLTGQKSIPDILAAWFYKGQVQCVLMGGGY